MVETSDAIPEKTLQVTSSLLDIEVTECFKPPKESVDVDMEALIVESEATILVNVASE